MSTKKVAAKLYSKYPLGINTETVPVRSIQRIRLDQIDPIHKKLLPNNTVIVGELPEAKYSKTILMRVVPKMMKVVQ